jgi:hypothetical protein
MKIGIIIFFLLLFSYGLPGCGLSGPLRTDPKAKIFETGSLGPNWKKAALEGEESSADFIYVNQKTSAYIAVNSMCKRYPDSSLASLSKQLMGPMSNAEIIAQEKLMIDEREALSTRSKGLLDGVAVEAKFVVVRKNECIFDFSLVAGKRIFDEDEEDFDRLVKGFRYLGGIKE